MGAQSQQLSRFFFQTGNTDTTGLNVLHIYIYKSQYFAKRKRHIKNTQNTFVNSLMRAESNKLCKYLLRERTRCGAALAVKL